MHICDKQVTTLMYISVFQHTKDTDELALIRQGKGISA